MSDMDTEDYYIDDSIFLELRCNCCKYVIDC